MTYKVAIITRKSPGKQTEKETSIKKQIDICKEYSRKNIDGTIEFSVFSDSGVSGDDKIGRIELFKFLKDIHLFDYACCLDVDRFSRSYLGMYWFHEYFESSNCKLIFVNGPKLYDSEGTVNLEGYLHFFVLCAFSSYELMKIRQRTRIGMERAKKTGKKMGRSGIFDSDPELCREIIKKKDSCTYRELSEEYGLNISMLKKIINTYSKRL